MAKKIAVVLFNLGGPDNLEAVKPFLFNLFNDRAIISLPNPFRFLLAKLISSRRAPIAQEIYGHLGGRSPILPLTEKQASALENELNNQGGVDYKTFIAMRYWYPMTEEIVAKVKAYEPDEIMLVPLYPQFSTTTTGSSVNIWKKEAEKQGLDIATRILGCYPTQEQFIEAHSNLIREYYEKAVTHGKPRLLFSAHGLPEKIVKNGDPYAWQVARTTEAIIAKLDIDDLDWHICFQSRVGPVKWLEPNTEDEIKQAGSDGVPLVIIPIAFVSEHSETLVELDIEYKKLADDFGVPAYFRVPALGDHPEYIKSLAAMCKVMEQGNLEKFAFGGGRLCPPEFSQCLCKG